VLFSLHRALAIGVSTVIVVEGFFDTLAVHQAGCPAVVGLMGSTLSRYQADQLTTNFRSCRPDADGDEAAARRTEDRPDARRAHVGVRNFTRRRASTRTTVARRDSKAPDAVRHGDCVRTAAEDTKCGMTSC